MSLRSPARRASGTNHAGGRGGEVPKPLRGSPRSPSGEPTAGRKRLFSRESRGLGTSPPSARPARAGKTARGAGLDSRAECDRLPRQKLPACTPALPLALLHCPVSGLIVITN